MRRQIGSLLLGASLVIGGCATQHESLESCLKVAERGLRPIAEDRSQRFLGKVREDTARCRGGERAVEARNLPWIDWQNYWAAGDASSLGSGSLTSHLSSNGRGIDGALLDLEYQRIELIKFNLFDTSGTYEVYVRGRDGVGGPALKVWPQMRLPKGHPQYDAVGGDQTQVCGGDLIRARTLTGICNDLKNPLMGSSRPAVRSQRAVRGDLPRAQPGAAHAQPAWRPPRPAQARSPGDQPPAVHPPAVQAGAVPRGPRPAGRADRRRLRLPEGAVLQRAGRVLDPVHDPRLVLASAGGSQRARPDVGRLRHRDGRLPSGRSHRSGLHRPERHAAALHRRRQGPPEPSLQDHREHRDGVVGRLADLRLRRDLAPPREARARRPGQAAAVARRPAGRRRRAPGLPAAARGLRSDEPPVGRAGGRRLPGQLDDRHELLPHGLRPGAQPVRRRLPGPGRRHARRRLRPAQPRAPRPGDPLPRRDRRRAVRGGAARRRRRDRQDPHHGVDAAAALRRAAVPRHERQLVRPLPRQGDRAGRAGEDHRQQLRQVDRREEGHAVVLGLRLRPRHLRTRQPRVLRRRDLRGLRSEQDRPLEHQESQRRQRRHQPLRLAVQLPGGVRHRLPAAHDGARSHRLPAVGRRAQPDPEQGRGGRDPAGPRDPGDARAGPGELGDLDGAAAAGPAHAGQPSAVSPEPRDPAAGQPERQDRRGRARPGPRPRAGRAALQRVPPPVRAAPAHQLRRLHRHQAAQGLAGARRAGAADRHHARDLRSAPLRQPPRSSPRRR